MIYVVDDSLDSARYLVRLLERAGYEAKLFTCGPDLLLALEGSPLPRLIILDFMMPGLSGLDCLKVLRKLPQAADLPVIIYSADFSYASMDEARLAGANEFIVKGTLRWPAFEQVVRKYAGEPNQVPSPLAPQSLPPSAPAASPRETV